MALRGPWNLHPNSCLWQRTTAPLHLKRDRQAGKHQDKRMYH